MKKISTIEKIALFFSFIALWVVIMGYIPFITTPEGVMFWSFHIDRVDDVTHGLTWIALLYAWLFDKRLSTLFLMILWSYYACDALFHMIDSLIWMYHIWYYFLVNLPHILISSGMLYGVYKFGSLRID